MNDTLVFHISIDGLTPSTIIKLGRDKLPNLYKIRDHGIFTDNGRTDYWYTTTLQNHTSMFTSRPSNPVTISQRTFPGHNVSFNSFNSLSTDGSGKDIHQINNNYVKSVFDMLKQHGLRSAIYVGKSKLSFFDESYDEKRDNIDEIDIYFYDGQYKKEPDTDGPIKIVKEVEKAVVNNNLCDYNFIHFKGTDTVGHKYGWNTDQYDKSLMAIDQDLGYLMSLLEKINQKKIFIVLTSDHGGGGDLYSVIGYICGHCQPNFPLNFTIPFYVLRLNHTFPVKDLYKFNKTRIEPKHNINPPYSDLAIPIRNGDCANFILYLFNKPPIENSFINKSQDLRIPI